MTSTRIYSHEGFLSDGKQMGGLRLPLSASVYLDHARDIERVDPSKGICGYKHYTTVCVDFLLRISKTDSLKHCRYRFGQ